MFLLLSRTPNKMSTTILQIVILKRFARKIKDSFHSSYECYECGAPINHGGKYSTCSSYCDYMTNKDLYTEASY
jgi:hypothetical protein